MSIHLQADAGVFYFGPPDRQLFGALHEAETYAQRETGFVICYPFGEEYIRAHRACRQLALRLAQHGFPTLRFDYGGTGDSSGSADEATLADWRGDVGSAMKLIQDRTGVERICLAGLRLGASLAFQAAGSSAEVSGLILWDPIISGNDYLVELADSHREVLWRYFDDFGEFDAGTSTEFLGFPISTALRDELSQLRLNTQLPARVKQVMIIESQHNPATEQLYELLQETQRECNYQCVPDFATWREDVDKGLVPDKVLRNMVDWSVEYLP